MINNNICENCLHSAVCEKLKVLCKFDESNKGYIGVDISIENCDDYSIKVGEDEQA